MSTPPALPTVALVGRPNVGKSTLFNRLCGKRDALVANFPGLTRDRQYGRAELGGRRVTLVDTGGLADFSAEDGKGQGASKSSRSLAAAVYEQVQFALDDAQLVVLVVDARTGLGAADSDIARQLRRRGLPVIVAANKIDGAADTAAFDFAGLGWDALPISATHGRGVESFAEAAAALLPPPGDDAPEAAEGIRVAIVGRPNVGKSTLVNGLLGEQRQVVSESPNTTRDAIDVPCGRYVLIDTAGVRRKGRVAEAVEKFSVVKTLGALDRAQVALLLVDGREGIVDQDLHILSYAIDAGAGVLLAVNKCDGLGASERKALRDAVARRLSFAPWVPVRFISAQRGTGVAALLKDVDAIHRAGEFDVKTAELNRILAEAVQSHAPPVVRSRQVKLRYAHKGGAYPPTVVIHGNQTESLPDAYLRFLANRFRDDLGLLGVAVKVETQTVANPFAGRRNELNRRQQKQRRRLIAHRRGR